jgi:hypothetical protein
MRYLYSVSLSLGTSLVLRLTFTHCTAVTKRSLSEKRIPTMRHSSFIVVAVDIFGLHIFTDHQLGVIIYKGKKSPTSNPYEGSQAR